MPDAEKDARDRGVLSIADLAWVEKAVIDAYAWAVRVADATGSYPSLSVWRASVTPPAGGREGDRRE